jgi:hypothetical protein
MRCALRGRAPAHAAPASGSRPHQHPEGVCTDDLLLRKPGFLLSAMHSREFVGFLPLPGFSCSLGFFPYSEIRFGGFLCVMFGEVGGGTLFFCLQKLYPTAMFECLLALFNFEKI